MHCGANRGGRVHWVLWRIGRWCAGPPSLRTSSQSLPLEKQRACVQFHRGSPITVWGLYGGDSRSRHIWQFSRVLGLGILWKGERWGEEQVALIVLQLPWIKQTSPLELKFPDIAGVPNTMEIPGIQSASSQGAIIPCHGTLACTRHGKVSFW